MKTCVVFTALATGEENGCLALRVVGAPLQSFGRWLVKWTKRTQKWKNSSVGLWRFFIVLMAVLQNAK